MCKCDICGKFLKDTTKYKMSGMVFCAKHYQQKYTKGWFLDSNPRTQKDPNEYVIDVTNRTARIYLYKNNEKIKEEGIIDLEDLERVKKKKWRLWRGRIYTGNFHPISLQYFVLGCGHNELDNKVIDHINSNPLDNRKANLRVCTQGQNVLNRRTPTNNNAYGFKGMYYDKSRHRWVAEIKRWGIKCFLGRYKQREDAVYVRYIAEKLLFGEFRSETNDTNITQEIKKCKHKNQLNTYVKHRLNDKYNINIE